MFCATFIFQTRSSAKCTDVTGTVRSTNSHWEVSSKSFQKSGSTATGTATGTAESARHTAAQ